MPALWRQGLGKGEAIGQDLKASCRLRSRRWHRAGRHRIVGRGRRWTCVRCLPLPDHVHMLISIPPKYSVAEVIGFLKGKSSIWIAQNVERKLRNFLGHKFWARGYFVSTIGRDLPL